MACITFLSCNWAKTVDQALYGINKLGDTSSDNQLFFIPGELFDKKHQLEI